MKKPGSVLPFPQFSLDALRASAEVIKALSVDRTLLNALPEEERDALLEAAGRLVHPTRDVKSRLAKARRRALKEEKRKKDREALATTKIRELRRAPIFQAPLLPETTAPSTPRRVLEQPRHCYVCKAEYRELHFFYDAMCTACGDLNHAKRFQTADLNGMTALVTGARVKIGYQIGLMHLRAGARLIVSTRFPNDAAMRYAREPDFEAWRDRLHIYGLDLRHAPSVELFARHIEATFDRLDILINNAAQTVRRPPGFYAHLSDLESKLAHELPAHVRPLLEGHARCVAQLSQPLSAGAAADALAPSWRSSDPSLGIRASAALSQVPYALEQQGDVEALFPSGRYDADLQQVDLRAVNTWRLTLAEVATAEMLEVHLVNAVAPFILCGKLKGLMLRDRTKPGHIVNVSAMEGSFSRGTKTDKHPHTNMAKAALNMMTLTSAKDYAQSNLYMNAVDTGWVTDEDPAVHAERKLQELDFQPPLDIVDGAARVVDPVFHAVRTGELTWGNFFKDYKPTAW